MDGPRDEKSMLKHEVLEKDLDTLGGEEEEDDTDFIIVEETDQEHFQGSRPSQTWTQRRDLWRLFIIRRF